MPTSPTRGSSNADLPKYEEILARRGYSPSDIEKVFYGNWLRLLREAWR